jgi:response regulator RpfG family c-di-GMP phosphodiesterase
MSNKQKTALVVDDEFDDLEALRVPLSADGFNVLTASDGKSAKALFNTDPDLNRSDKHRLLVVVVAVVQMADRLAITKSKTEIQSTCERWPPAARASSRRWATGGSFQPTRRARR